MRLLVAGITGQLGAGIVESCDAELVDLVPLGAPARDAWASARLRSAFPDRADLAAEAVEGDVTARALGPGRGHAAAPGGRGRRRAQRRGRDQLGRRQAALHAVNVLGALRGYQLAQALGEAAGTRKLYCYASSIHAAGGAEGSLPELPFGRHEHRTAVRALEVARRERACWRRHGATPTTGPRCASHGSEDWWATR